MRRGMPTKQEGEYVGEWVWRANAFVVFVGIVAICLLSVPNIAFAQAPALPCGGNIIEPSNPFNPNSALVTTPIANCADPFELTIDPPSTYSLYVDEVAVPHNGSAVVAEGGTNNLRVEGENHLDLNSYRYFLHDGDDYRFVNLEPSEPEEADYRRLALEFFPEGTDIEPYIATIVSGDYTMPDQEQQNLLYEFLDYVEAHFVPAIPKLGAGTYTLIIREYELILGARTPFERIFSFVIPTAHAAEGQYTFAITFTLTETPPEPEGASSVLFLPGIMGARLFEESSACGLGSGEKERWSSFTDCPQLRLITNAQGQSVNDIYTKANDSSVIDAILGFNLYESFFSALEDWESANIIDDFALIPYDWRLRLDELLLSKKDEQTGKIKVDASSSIAESYLYTELERLADESHTGKVTIVAHSNGGLLAKAFLATLESENDPLLAKIDTLILVGVPQLGTPSALMGILHGDDIGPGGTIVSQQTSRTLLNTAPFAFHLLPNAGYFDSIGVTVDTPVITFEPGTTTTPWANTYGQTIANATPLQTFLTTDGRTKPSPSDLAQPEVVDLYLFDNYTQNIATLINSWVPPATMQVKEIAGVGIETLSGLTYFTDTKCTKRNPLLFFKCTEYAPTLGMRPNMTIDGDKTVVTPSALGMSTTYQNVERWWLNLEKYNEQNLNRVHNDIFEVQDVIDFVNNTILATTSLPYAYLTNTPAVLPQENRLSFTLHSPLDLMIEDASGKKVSSSTETIQGGAYRRFGEIQYISIPDTDDDVTVKMQGLATGSFTLEVAEYLGTVVDKRHSYKAIPSSTSTKVTFVLEEGVPVEELPLKVDYDGNGTSDITYDVEGEIVPEITYTTLFDALNALTIKPLYKKLLLENARIAQQNNIKSLTNKKYKKLEIAALTVLKQQVLFYENIRALSTVQKQELLGIIDGLMSK